MKVAHMTVSLMLIACLAAMIALRFGDDRCMAADEPAEAGKDRKPNRLIRETSPYLLQHAYNPVDWHPWGPEAFEKAKREDKPIFLSVGYSTCHWCHVMERESFESEEIAAVMNEHFVCIKVDREELPDVDAQFMLATQIMTQRGGWPNSVWLTPDGKPWFAGTYFPPDDRFGRPGFKSMLLRLAEIWKTRRDDVNQQAENLSTAIREYATGSQFEAAESIDGRPFERMLAHLQGQWDSDRGGFGTAPKFPPHGSLALILRRLHEGEDKTLTAMLTSTLDAMRSGGMYDHLGGGFHRYSTDARWLLPHFEKMLYDNAQLIRAYADGYLLTKRESYKRTIAEVFQWLEREMTDGGGAFYSAIDADSEGEEGKFYVWTRKQIIDVIGQVDGDLFCAAYGATGEGNFVEEATRHRTGANVLHLPAPIERFAEERGLDAGELDTKLTAMRQKLLAARAERIRPHLDDKILSSWNGLMISSLAHAGRVLNEPRYVAAAKRAADFVLERMRDGEGRLYRAYRAEKARVAGYLDDYAFLADGLLELHEATKDDKYLAAARGLMDVLFRDFHDAQRGGFYFTSDRHDDLLARGRGAGGGGNIPDGNGVAAQALVRLAKLTGEARYAQAAEELFRGHAGQMIQAPYMSENLLLALDSYLADTGKDELVFPKSKAASAVADADARSGDVPVFVGLYVSRESIRPGETAHLAVRLAVDEGYHIYAANEGVESLVPSTVTIEPSAPGVTIGAVTYPEPKILDDPVAKKPLRVYQGEMIALASVTAAADAPAGVVTLKVTVRTQACDDKACLLPRTHGFEVSVDVSNDAAGEARHPALFDRLIAR